MARGIQLPPVEYDLVRLTGGMDLVTPTLSLPPGYSRDSLNFEALVSGGYARVGGYERFSGQPAPSDATVSGLTVAITGSISVGATITGGTSGATGVVVFVNSDEVAFTKETGTFLVGENVLVAAVPQATVVAIGLQAHNSLFNAQLRAMAANVYRADIGAVPGSGPVRGIASLGEEVYAWRDNVGGTAAVIHHATPSGWQAVGLGHRLQFQTGGNEVFQGQTINGQTSGATALVQRVALRSGAWSGTAAGILVLTNIVGTFQNGENIRVGATVIAVAVGSQVAQTLQPGGRYEFYDANFGGATGKERIYGCDGVNTAFEFDGAVFVPIPTGMAVDQPTHVIVHKKHLFLSFGASVQHSALGNPFAWTAVLGAAELVVLDTVTNFRAMSGAENTGALAIFSRNTSSLLYGTSSADWNLVNYQDSTGALPRSAQSVVSTYVLDDRGVMGIANTLSFGNFDSASLTQNIQPWLEQRQAGLQCSTVNRRKSQYRMYFDDGSALYMTLNNKKLVGAMPMMFGDIMFCASESEVGGVQVIYCGGSSGFVYKMDVGTSFDGAMISATLPLVFNSVRSPRTLKRYRKAAFEMAGTGYAEFSVTHLLGYASDLIAQPAARGYDVPFRQTFWDSFVWDAFTWDGVNLAPAEIELGGSAENISIQIASEGDFYEPFTINTIIMHYTPRRGLR